MDKSLNKHAFAYCIVVLCGCLVFDSSKLSPFGKTFAQQSRLQTVAETKKLGPGLIASDPEASRVWQAFSKRNNYRLARADDFVLSADRYRSYGEGDFNGDQIYSDIAMIVIDNTRTDASRFSLIIFNARKDSKGYDGPFWLYRHVDLSRTSLNLISHGPLIVAETRDQNQTRVCVVRWTRSPRGYRCEESP